jgi:disulfide bond formation protein DsbB
MFKLKVEFYLKTIFIFSAIALSSAFFIEYILGHQPCNLCILERIPYGLSLVLISTIFILRKNEKFFILLLIITFIFSLAISFYHYGIEQGFFEESAVCGVKDFTENITKEDLLKQLSEKTVSCKDVTFRILGLSLTSINIVVSIIFIITLTKIYNNYEKNKQ